VRLLREEPWPDDLLGTTALGIFYAASLSNYAATYAWEINQREKVVAKGAVDLKAWDARADLYRGYSGPWRRCGSIATSSASRRPTCSAPIS